MSKPVVASYCTTFLKPEMLHIYRQVTGLQKFETFIIAKERRGEDRFPFGDVEVHPRVRSNFVRRFWLKYVIKEPPIVYRGEYGVLNRILERRHADLMHIYFGHTGVHLLPFIQRWPRPVVVSFHGMDVQPREDKPGYLQNLQRLLQTIPLVMVRSESLKDRIIELGCPPAKVRMNRTGIPMDAFRLRHRAIPKDGAWHLVQACRLIEKKGLNNTIRVFGAFAADKPGARLTIAGEGPLRPALEALVASEGLSDKVRFAGFLTPEALCDLYESAHIFIHPSRLTEDLNQEGVPNSMLEAMATGLPVLATLHGGIPEAVTHERSGLLSPENDEAALLNHLRRLTSELGLWTEMSQSAATEVREKFEQGAQIQNLEAVYTELLELGGAHPG